MSIHIPPRHHDFVRDELASGHFANEQDLVDEAIQLLRARQAVLAKVRNGIDQIQRGEGVEYGPRDRQQFLADILGRSGLSVN